MKQTVGMALAVFALAAAPAFAQSGQAGQSAKPDKPSQQDTRQTGTSGKRVAAADTAFAKEAAVGGMAEVDLGKLAQQNAASPDVKQFAERMVTDHGKANAELKEWASQNNVTLPTKLDAKHQALRERLSKLNGDAFDKAYMKAMLSDHKEDVAKFRKESSSASNPELKAWAGQTLPTLEDHLKLAQDTASKVGVSDATAKDKK
jgi:putative membrane protein